MNNIVGDGVFCQKCNAKCTFGFWNRLIVSIIIDVQQKVFFFLFKTYLLNSFVNDRLKAEL